MKYTRQSILVFALALSLAAFGCTTTAQHTGPQSFNKPGFVTEVVDGRLWVFRSGSKDYDDFKKHGEPAKMVSRIGGGPNGMTIRSGDAKTIDDYLAAR
jgi:hypothetical protein